MVKFHLLLTNYWPFFFVIIFIIGIFSHKIAEKKLKSIYQDLLNNASLIKSYWKFCFFYIIIAIILYYLTLSYVKKENLDIAIQILSQFLAIIFAIFVGYYAFLQVVNMQFDDIKEKGHEAIKNDEFLRGKEFLNTAHSINSRDIPVLLELIEVLIITRDFKNAEDKLSYLQKIIIERRESILFYFFKSLIHIFKEHLSEARGEINNIVNFIHTDNNSQVNLIWDFSDLLRSQKDILSGESWKLLNNTINYLDNKLTSTEKEKFDSGNFLLN